MSEIPHEDWVSSVSCETPGWAYQVELQMCFDSRTSSYFWTASYDGYLRAFDYSKNAVFSTLAHSAPVTSVCTVPTQDFDETSYLLGTASHDMSAQLIQVSLPAEPSQKATSKTLAKLHLHTAPVSSIASNTSGTHLLTSSWDNLIGLWDTAVPISDEVPEPTVTERERKRRRKLDSGEDSASKPKRKAPITVLKSHTARVSRVVFGRDHVAYSCGFDSTVRLWDTENGVCTHTIVGPSVETVEPRLTFLPRRHPRNPSWI
jgi:ribosome biogenesis protein